VELDKFFLVVFHGGYGVKVTILALSLSRFPGAAFRYAFVSYGTAT